MNIKHEKYFINAINSGSIQEIKIAICLYIDKDASDSENQIKSAMEYLDSKGINIWQTHKEIEVTKPREQWNVDYIGLLQSDLMYNFSKERLNLIMEVGKYIYTSKQSIERNITSYGKSTHRKVETTKIDNKHKEDIQKSSSPIMNNQQNYVSHSNKNRFDDKHTQKTEEMKAEHRKKKEIQNEKKEYAKPTPQGSNRGTTWDYLKKEAKAFLGIKK